MAFYVRVAEDRFESTEHTRGPWDPRTQHAGPPAALLGRAVEAHGRPDMRVARLTFDIAKPVPIAPLLVTSSVVREGRSVMVVQAAIEPYLRCTALLMRAAPRIAPEVRGEQPPPLAGAEAKPFFPGTGDVGYHTAMEVRFADGSFTEPGPATAWMRMRIPLVAGEPPSPLARVLVAADSGNGISGALDFRAYLFVNVDLSVHLSRYPTGEWVCLRAATHIDGAGLGVADTALYDERARIGRSVQSLFVNPRQP
jgi:hypothetical protein